MHQVVEQLKSEGYAIIRGFLSPAEIAAVSARDVDRIYAEGLKHHATYRHKNLLFEILDDPKAQRRVVLQAHWTAWISPLMERMRRSDEYLAVLKPFLGEDVKQITHQVHWKPPGAKYTFYRFHQDARFREGKSKDFDHLHSTVTTGLAIDRQTAANGALRIIPRSHRLGYLGLSDDGPIMVGETPRRGAAPRGARSGSDGDLRDGAGRSVALDAVHRARLGAERERLRPAFHDQQLRPRER